MRQNTHRRNGVEFRNKGEIKDPWCRYLTPHFYRTGGKCTPDDMTVQPIDQVPWDDSKDDSFEYTMSDDNFNIQEGTRKGK